MDIFVFDNVKAEKLKALLNYNRLQTLSNLFRLFEICLALLLLSWISARLPLLLRLSADYLRQLLHLLLSPLFIFLLSNLIVLTLLHKSRRLSPSSEDEPPQTELYENLIEAAETDLTPAEKEIEIACVDKEMISDAEIVNTEKAEQEGGNMGKVLRRSKSESVKEAEKEKPKKLRRSETEMRRKEETAEKVEQLTTEEFNRTVEEFIAKQMKFHLEEKVTVVSCS